MSKVINDDWNLIIKCYHNLTHWYSMSPNQILQKKLCSAIRGRPPPLFHFPAFCARPLPDGVVSRACPHEHIAADQSTAGLCKAERANRLTTSNTKCITVHLLLTRIDGLHCPVGLRGFFNMDLWLLSAVRPPR